VQTNGAYDWPELLEEYEDAVDDLDFAVGALRASFMLPGEQPLPLELVEAEEDARAAVARAHARLVDRLE
jgi:hypothetical protein